MFVDDLARIRAAVPGAGELERGLVPHGLDEALRDRTVSFTKGCYPGQELVARLQARHATPPYVLRRCRLDAAALVGDPVGDSDKDGGITSVALDVTDGTWWALCVLHRRDAELDVLAVRASTPTLARLD